jgi:hypothetical protein
MTRHSPQQSQKPSAPVQTSAALALDPQMISLSGHERHTIQTMMQLQRVIGNQGVQRLIGGGLPTRSRLQRADTGAPPAKEEKKETGHGLLGEGAVVQYAAEIHKFVSDPAKKTLPVSILIHALGQALVAQLTPMGIPTPNLYLGDADTNYALTNGPTWSIEFNAERHFGSVSKTLGEVTEDEIARAADTMYHEGRHVEQYFRIAQWRAQKMLEDGVPVEKIKTKVSRELRLQREIVSKALDASLQTPLDPEFAKQIETWYEGSYGHDRAYQDIVYGMNPQILEPTRELIGQIYTAAYLEIGPQPNPATGQLPGLIAKMGKQLEIIYKYSEEVISPKYYELDEKATGAPDDPNTIMKTHLMHIGYPIETMVADPAGGFLQLPSDPQALITVLQPVIAGITQIKNALDAASWDLADQKDADDAGTKAQEALNKLFKNTP